MCRKTGLIYFALLFVLVGSASAEVVIIETVTAASQHDSGLHPAENTINYSGMRGDYHDMWHNHTWITNPGGGGDENPHTGTELGATWIKYEFDDVYILTELWIWNYNGDPGGNMTDRGLKNVTIEYTSDGTTWQKLGDYVFNRATHEASYAHNTTVSFNGALAKAVVITAKGGAGEGNWGAADKLYGLSEVCFYTSKPSPLKNVRLAEKLEREKLQEFQNCRLRPQGWRPYMFEPGSFPVIQWEKPGLVERLVGKFPLRVRWFDSQLNEVTVAEKPGRYMAVVEATAPNSINIKRAMTLYCRDKDFRPWTYYKNKACLDYIPGEPFDKEAWQERSDFIASEIIGKRFIEWLQTDEKGAMVMAYLAEMKPLGRKLPKTESPEILHDDYHLALKRKLLGVEGKWAQLKMPRKIKGSPALVLRAGTPEQAGVKHDTAEKIRRVCKEWYEASKEPFAVLVARRGVVIIHEAFGRTLNGPITVDKPMYIASITKAITGLMFAQFVDQGLIGIDDPVGKFLPDFPIEGDKALTFHHCFTHTSGLEGHGEWGGMHNPRLENVIANALATLKPGEAYHYNGMGFDLAGKVMEIVSGKSIFRLMQENFFVPLGMKDTTMEEDLAYGTTSTAMDMARVGQLLLNKGSYGDIQFFSEETFKELLPQQLNKFYPKVPWQYGIGLALIQQPHPDAGKEGVPKDATILSQNVVGHDGASGAMVRVDLDNELVIVQTRDAMGKDYGKYLAKFLTAIEEGV